jgi:hypothetical protein
MRRDIARSYRRWTVILIAIALTLTAIPAMAAEPDGDGPVPGPEDEAEFPPVAPLVEDGAKGKPGGITTLAVEYSPAGCEGYTDNAHPSTHQPKTVNVQSKTLCDRVVTRLYLETRLQRLRWYGWQTISTTEKASTSNQNIYNNASKSCESTAYTYRGRTYHSSTEAGKVYSTTTISPSNSRIKLVNGACRYD